MVMPQAKPPKWSPKICLEHIMTMKDPFEAQAPPPMPRQAIDPQQGRQVLQKLLGAAKKNGG